MARGDRGLKRVRAPVAAERVSSIERGQATADEELIPQRGFCSKSTMALQRDRPARAPATPESPSARSGRGLQVLRASSARIRPSRNTSLQSPAASVRRGSRRVPFVEEEIEDSKHRRQPSNTLFATRHFERHLLRGERSLALTMRSAIMGSETRNAGQFRPSQAAEQAKCKHHLRLGRKYSVAADEEEPEQIVADAIGPFVDRRLGSGQRLFAASSRPIYRVCAPA